MCPETRYAKSGDINIAYQVVGDGPFDLVVVPGWISNVDFAWEDPLYGDWVRRLTAFSRVILFDKRGTGLSDRDVGDSTLEERMDDLRTVLAAAGSERAAVIGFSEGGALSILFAATYPERVRALVLYGSFARATEAADYPEGVETRTQLRYLRAHGCREVQGFIFSRPLPGNDLRDLLRRNPFGATAQPDADSTAATA